MKKLYKPFKLIILLALSLVLLCFASSFLTACKPEDNAGDGGATDNETDGDDFTGDGDGSGGEDGETEKVAVESVSLNKNVLTLELGETETLTAKVLPENADNKAVEYYLTDPQYSQFISVSVSGAVKALSVGAGVVGVKTADGEKTAFCSVVVTTPSATGVEFDKNSILLGEGESEKITATVLPDGALVTVIYETLDASVATVLQDGTVIAVGLGETTVRAYVAPDIYAVCDVRVGYRVTCEFGENGTAECEDGLYFAGDKVRLLATPYAGYILDGWYENGEKIGTGSYFFYTVKGDATVTAKFAVDPEAPIKNENGFFEIRTGEDLKWADMHYNSNYILMNNIDMPNGFNGFDWFSGILDGNGYSIYGVSLEFDNNNFKSGFFEYLCGTVKNLTLKNVVSHYNYTVGLLAASAENATIENCHVNCEFGIICGSPKIGGLVAVATNTKISGCSANIIMDYSKVNGVVGGLVGFANGCEIDNSFAKVNIRIGNEKDSLCGGFIGEADSSNKIKNCYSKGSIIMSASLKNANSKVFGGGFIAKNAGLVEKCYSAVSITVSAWISSGGEAYGAGFCTKNTGTVTDSLFCGSALGRGEEKFTGYAFCNECGDNNFILDLSSTTDLFARENVTAVDEETLKTAKFYRETLGWDETWVLEDGSFPRLPFETT